jgi:Cu-processing system permease protein
VKSRDKARGIGAALLLWFYFALIYDGLVMMVLFAFSDYPIEKLIMLLLSLNPVDLGRVFIMLQMDVSALMGASGAIVKSFFDSGTGVILTLGIMVLWIVAPLLLAIRSFNKKDL